MSKFLYICNTGNYFTRTGFAKMGSNNIDLKKDVISLNNQINGYNPDGSKPGYGLADTGFEKTVLAGGCLMPVWQYKGKIGEAWQNRSWQNFGSAYKKGAQNAWTTIKHPVRYWDIEFVNSKVSKLENIMKNATPELPEDFSGNSEAKKLFEKLKNAKSRQEYSSLVRNNQKTYRKLRNILDKTAPEELKKLQKVAQYNEMYGDVLKDFKTAQTSLQNGRPLPKGQLDVLHKKFADARLAENKFITNAKKAAQVSKKAKAGAKMSKNVKKAMAASKTLRGVSRSVGKAGGWILAGMSAVTAGLDIYTAVAASPKGEGLKNGLKQAAKSTGRLACEIGGMAVGQWAGAAIGQVLIPIPGVGAAIGGFLGSMVGGWLGSKLADNIPAINKTVAEEITEEQTEDVNKQLAEAIDNNDIETVYNYTSQFKEQVVDEQGNPVLDDNGNPTYNYVKISDDEEEQKAFEERVASLDNYVETEATKLQRAEELKQEVEAAKATQQGPNGFGYGTNSSYKPSEYISGFGITRAGQQSSASNGYVSWQNPAWQDSLANRYNSSNFYAFDPSNYSPLWKPSSQSGFGYAA